MSKQQIKHIMPFQAKGYVLTKTKLVLLYKECGDVKEGTVILRRNQQETAESWFARATDASRAVVRLLERGGLEYVLTEDAE